MFPLPQRRRGPNPRRCVWRARSLAIGLAALITAVTGDDGATNAASAAPVSQSIGTTTTTPPSTTTLARSPTTTTTIPTTTRLVPVTATRVFVLGDSALLGAVRFPRPSRGGDESEQATEAMVGACWGRDR